MIILEYKRDVEVLDLAEYGTETIKVYRVLRDGKAIGYITKDIDFGWIFYKDQNSNFLGGYETLKECKEWLSEIRRDGKAIIELILKN